MDILIVFDSVEGHTRKVAGHVGDLLQNRGHAVTLTKAGDPAFCDPGEHDLVFLCAPIHVGRYPPSFTQYVQNWKSVLASVPNAFVSISLAINSEHEDERTEARAFPDHLAEETGWKADEIHHAAGALKYLEYDFFKRWMMRRIAEKEGGPIDTSRDHELTDWQALDEFVFGFLARHDPGNEDRAAN